MLGTRQVSDKAPIAIYVDADACPVKDEAVRVAERHGLHIHFVSNAFMRLPEGPLIHRVVVAEGPDAADDWIVEHIGARDIAVTADIPLAARSLQLSHAGPGFEEIAGVDFIQISSPLQSLGKIQRQQALQFVGVSCPFVNRVTSILDQHAKFSYPFIFRFPGFELVSVLGYQFQQQICICRVILGFAGPQRFAKPCQ